MTTDATDSITAEDKPFDGKCPVCGEDDWYVNDDEENECNNCSHVLEDEEDPEPTCEWKFDYRILVWKSTCNQTIYSFEDGPEGYDFKYCPYCGKPIKVM